jgi:hypothetical protein
LKTGNRNIASCASLLSIFALTLFRCGIYSFSGSTLPSHIKTVAVPLFQNQTPEFGVDQQITDTVIDAINQDNTLKIAGLRQCDAILRGTIQRITEQAGQYDQNENASSFRVTLTVTVAFEDVKKHDILWEETWSEWGSYSDNREEGLQEAMGKISTNIVNRSVSGW